MKGIVQYINESREVTFKKKKGVVYAYDHVGIMGQITHDEDRDEYYCHFVQGLGNDHYEPTLKDAKEYFKRL